jgi:hypothetical protein
MGFRLYIICSLIILFTNFSNSWGQCFTVGTASTSTTTSAGDWTVGGNWSSGSPGCSINGENDEIEVNVNMTLQNTSCGGGTLTMTAKTNLQVVSNSTLTIEGDLNLNGEEICIYVQAGSTLRILGDLNFSKDKISLIVDGSLDIDGEFACSGDCTGGGSTFPAFGGSGTYSAGGGCSGFSGAQTQCSAALPVELLYFEAAANEKNIELNWSTVSEINNDFFTVEKIIDGNATEFVSRVDGNGNSSEILVYSTIDRNPHGGTNYYHLKQTDFDGQFSYSDIISINYDNPVPQIRIFPNPIVGGNDINIYINGLEEAINLFVFDISGRLIKEDFYSSIEKEQIRINKDFLQGATGIYQITIVGSSFSTSTRLIVAP